MINFPLLAELERLYASLVRQGRLEHRLGSFQRLECVGRLFDAEDRSRKTSKHDGTPADQLHTERAQRTDLPARMEIPDLA
jgi:hypothetical protein